MHAGSPADLPTVLIAAISGRALAQAARRSGFLPLVADFFCDLDTQEAGPAALIGTDYAMGFSFETLKPILDNLAAGRNPIGLVCGAGFEHDPGILDDLATSWTLLGNSSATVGRAKEPTSFALLCQSCRIPHPAISMTMPEDSSDWLAKRQGGSGGSHVLEDPVSSDHRNPSVYYQRRVEGEPVSLLFAASGQKIHSIGFSRQWASPSDGQPFRYGGAVRPAGISRALELKLEQDVAQIAELMPLQGLNSADFLVNENGYHLLEINPRPGATLDVFPPGLFRIHVDACHGVLPRDRFKAPGATAAAIVYSESEISTIPRIQWPSWTMDRQSPGTRVGAGDPLCTVSAEAQTAEEALVLIEKRISTIRTVLENMPS